MNAFPLHFFFCKEMVRFAVPFLQLIFDALHRPSIVLHIFLFVKTAISNITLFGVSDMHDNWKIPNPGMLDCNVD